MGAGKGLPPPSKRALPGAHKQKAPAGAFWGEHRQESGGGERLDLRGQAALGAGGLVLVDDLLVRDAVEDRDGLLKGALGGGFVARFDRLGHTLVAVRRVECRLALRERYVCLTGCAALRRQLAQHLRVRLRHPEQSLSGP
jgi:hypothetical protein